MLSATGPWSPEIVYELIVFAHAVRALFPTIEGRKGTLFKCLVVLALEH